MQQANPIVDARYGTQHFEQVDFIWCEASLSQSQLTRGLLLGTLPSVKSPFGTKLTLKKEGGRQETCTVRLHQLNPGRSIAFVWNGPIRSENISPVLPTR